MATIFPPRPPPPTTPQIEAALQTCLTVSQRAVAHGKQLFGACLTGPDNDEILLTHGNVDHVHHARVQPRPTRRTALQSTGPLDLHSIQHLGAVRHVHGDVLLGPHWQDRVFRVGGAIVRALTGPGQEENLTMALPCRKVLEGSQKDVEVIGPFEASGEVVVEAGQEYWRPLRQAREHAPA